jgi:ABC-type Fe3+/spermidine/putrescine transport system ATPase subunit/ABC-type spermidine/putrescine transport system permease subunit II
VPERRPTGPGGVLLGAAFALPIAALVVRAFADAWRAPDLVPQRLGLRGFEVAFGGARGVEALGTSGTVALLATTLAVAIGWPAARVLGERRLRHPAPLFLLLALPLLVPPYAAGFGLTEWFIRLGLSGTTAGLVLVHLLLVLPYVVVVLLSGFGPPLSALEEMAVTHGVRPAERLVWVTLPSVAPTLAAAALLGFLVSWSQYGSSLAGRGGTTHAAAGHAALRAERPAGRGRARPALPAAGRGRADRHHAAGAVAAVSVLRCTGVEVAAGGAPVLRGVDLTVASGALTALVGPSGAGKTTLLRAIAGLTPLTRGEIALGERSLAGVPVHRRRIAVVFQEPRLLPHLNVVDNVALPLRAAKVPRAERRRRAGGLLAEVGLGGFAERRVPGLSGGEQQRVALARALCADPDLLLLDEPLAALDPGRREGLRGLIGRLQRERALTTVVITHDRAEAAELGDRVALMLEGRIVQHDEPRAVFERPSSAAVARFFGAVNLLRGTVDRGELVIGAARLAVTGPDGPAVFAVRPEHVAVSDDGQLPAVVTEAVYAGTHVRLVLRAGDQRVEAHVPVGSAPAAGDAVLAELPSTSLWRLPDGDAAAWQVPEP